MYKFSDRSQANLSECHGDLRVLFQEVILYRDCTILEGHRPKEKQDLAVERGNSTLKWPKSKHNSLPSMAVDVIPYPIDWEDKLAIAYFAGYVMRIADNLLSKKKMHHQLRWGGDWNHNNEVNDQKLIDLVHFELVLPK